MQIKDHVFIVTGASSTEQMFKVYPWTERQTL
jgi:hypothetical protein